MLHPSVDLFHAFLNTFILSGSMKSCTNEFQMWLCIEQKSIVFRLFQTSSNHFTQYHLLLQLNGERSLPIFLPHADLPLAGVLCSLFSFSYFIWNALVPRLVFSSRWKLFPIPSVAFLILVYLFWNNILQLALRGWVHNGFINRQNTNSYWNLYTSDNF